jgi:hypothetical protein
MHGIAAAPSARAPANLARAQSLNTLVIRNEPGSPVTRSDRSVLSSASSISLAGHGGNVGKASLTDFCNRLTARAPEQPLDSCAGERLATPTTPVEARLTPRLQLQPRFRRSPRESRGEERHTGSDASLRGCCRPLATLEARPLTPLSPSERARMGECQSRRALVKEHVASSPRRLPSTDAPFACLRCAGDPPPYPGLSRRRAGFQHLASTLSREAVSLPRHPGFVTPKPGR